MFNTAAYGKAVVKYIQGVNCFQFCCVFLDLDLFCHMETVPMPMSPLRCLIFEKLTLL